VRSHHAVNAAHYDPDDIIRQRPLQRLGLLPRRAHPNIPFLIGRQDHGMALGWIGSTTAFGAVVKKP
jgi:hypothetical protein